MRFAPILPFVLVAGLLACQPAGTPTAGGSASPSAGASVPKNWPPGVPPPPTPKPGPSVGPSEKDATNLAITYTPPHVILTASDVPAGVFSVIYVVTSLRDRQDTLQIDAVDPASGFTAKLIYSHLVRGDYRISCYAKGMNTPLDVRTITVP